MLWFNSLAIPMFKHGANSQLKNLTKVVRFFSVDRGEVEPLEQVGKTAPETARTRPSSPQKYFRRFLRKEKLPIKGALRSNE